MTQARQVTRSCDLSWWDGHSLSAIDTGNTETLYYSDHTTPQTFPWERSENCPGITNFARNTSVATCLHRVTVAQNYQSTPLSSKIWKIRRLSENLAWSLCKTDSPIVIKFFWSIHFINWIWFVCAKYSPRTSFFAKLTTWRRDSRTEILDADRY